MGTVIKPRAALVLMCGRSFSGKTTISNKLASAIHAQVISLDSINEERGLFGGQGMSIEEWIRTNDEAKRRASTALTAGLRVVVDDTSSPRFLRDNWRKVAAEADSVFVLIYVDTPLELTRARLIANRQTADRNDVLDEIMKDHLAAFEPPASDEDHVTTGSSDEEIEALVDVVLARI